MSFAAILGWILQGLGTTLQVTACSLLVAAPFALVCGVLEHRCRGLARGAVVAVVEFWRSSSVIILLYAFFYILPVVGIALRPLTVGSLVIGCSVGAFASQAVRATLAALPRGQVEAALSLGLSRNRALLLVELPQALRTMLPIFGNEIIELIKTTANVSLITMADMTFRAKAIMQVSYKPTEIYGSLILIYVVLCGSVALAIGWGIRRMAWSRAG